MAKKPRKKPRCLKSVMLKLVTHLSVRYCLIKKELNSVSSLVESLLLLIRNCKYMGGL